MDSSTQLPRQTSANEQTTAETNTLPSSQSVANGKCVETPDKSAGQQTKECNETHDEKQETQRDTIKQNEIDTKELAKTNQSLSNGSKKVGEQCSNLATKGDKLMQRVDTSEPKGGEINKDNTGGPELQSRSDNVTKSLDVLQVAADTTDTSKKDTKDEQTSGNSTSNGDNANENKTLGTDKASDKTESGKNNDAEKEGEKKDTCKDNTDGKAKSTENQPVSLEEKYPYRSKCDTLEQALEKAKCWIEELKKFDNYLVPDSLFVMKRFNRIYFDYKRFTKKLSQYMVDSGFPALMLSMVKQFNNVGIFSDDSIWYTYYYILNNWWNYSDTSFPFAEALAEIGLVSFLTKNVAHKPFTENVGKKNVFYIIKASISILHNIARIGTLKNLFDESKTSEALIPFLNHEREMLKILANLTVAHIVDEDTNKKQILGPETIEQMIIWTGKALGSVRGRCNGFVAFELIDGLNKIAVNDSNKMTIVDKGAIPVLQKMLESVNKENQASACKMLWTLAFDKDVRLKIKENGEVMTLLETLKGSEDSRIQKNASGALWVIKREHEITDQTRPKTAESKQHVMLSYSWSDKEMVLQIKDRLQAAGFTVWIDVENMGGSTLEAMAAAIEHASVVVMCMSEKYKSSPNCRTEAEYTFQLRKVFVPLMMQTKYKPDGWLGIMLGAKLFFDFSGKYPFEKTFGGLLRELHSSQNKGIPTEKVQVAVDDVDGTVVASTVSTTYTQPGKTQVTRSSLTSNVFTMDQANLAAWLKKEAHLETCIAEFQKFKIDGKLLAQLIVMRSEAPEYFYRCLEKRLNMDLTEVLQFTSALDELTT